MDAQGTAAIGAGHGGASSPTSARNGVSGAKRKRSGAGFESSPGSVVENDEEEAERRRQPGVKRACNECRQQKVSHENRTRGKSQRRAIEKRRANRLSSSFDVMSSKIHSQLARDVSD
jgi:hypothetical protein